jgi:hypothetical protein
MNTKHLLEIDDNLTKAVNEIEFMVGERTEIAHKHILIAQKLIKNLSLPVVSKSVDTKTGVCKKCKANALETYIDGKQCTSCGYVC